MATFESPFRVVRQAGLRRMLLVLGVAALAGCAQTGGAGDEGRSRGGGFLGGPFSSGRPGSQWKFVQLLGKHVRDGVRPEATLLRSDQVNACRAA